MPNVTAANTAESEAAIASLKVGDVLSFLYERGELYNVTEVETCHGVFDDCAEVVVWVQCRRRADRRARLRASYTGKGGFRFQIAGPTYCGLPTMIPGFEVVTA